MGVRAGPADSCGHRAEGAPRPERGLIAVVGAGAAGLSTAIFARRRGAPSPVVALDGARTLGAKILVSGGGRCNVTNRVVVRRDFNGGGGALGRILAGFDVEATVAFFREIGVPLREEENGKLFPVSGKARTVLDALLAEARRLDVEIRTGARVLRVERASDEEFRVHTTRGSLNARRVVLATGGRSLPKTGSDGEGYALAASFGHTVTIQTPALVPLVLEDGLQRGLSGVAVDVELDVRCAPRPLRLRGPLLFTHFGVSGPVVLDASRHWCQARARGLACEISASFLPGLDFAAAEAWLLDAARTSPAGLLRAALADRMPASLAAALLARAGAAEDTRLGRLARETRRRLLAEALGWRMPVRESRGYNVAEVTAGGVPLSEMDPATLESRRASGLHLVGEMVDVDGRLGGFNFQWAWCSAWAAAGGLARGV